MLHNKELFDNVENELRENGKLQKLEHESGKIKGRMMIVKTEISAGIDYVFAAGKNPTAFEASFDFFDSVVGLALYTDTKQAATGIWIIPQINGAVPPEQEWIEFFVEKLMLCIREDGSYSYPVYSFVNDTDDMTIIPIISAETD